MKNIFQRYGLLGLALMTFYFRTTDGVLSIDETSLEGYENFIVHSDHLSTMDNEKTIERIQKFLKD